MPVREWVRLDIGLLDDERFESMDADDRSVWVTAYLLISRAGDAVKDKDTLARLLAKQMGWPIAQANTAVAGLEEAGWIVASTRKTGITLRGYDKAQPIYRGPSDSPEAKAERNAKRPTTRAGRGASGGARGATRTDGTDKTPPAPPRGRGVEREPVAPRNGPMKGLKEVLGPFEEVIKKSDDTAKRSTS